MGSYEGVGCFNLAVRVCMKNNVTKNDVVYNPQEALQLLSQDSTIAFDIETSGLSPWRDRIALMQFYGDMSKTPVLIRIRDGVIPTEVNQLFKQDKLFIGHNVAAFDCLFLGTHDVPWDDSRWYDTLIGECIISTTGRRDVSKSLKESIRRRLGLKIDKDIAHGAWEADVLSDDQVTYAVEDVAHLHDLHEAQVTKAIDQGQLNALNMEMILAPAMSRMTLNGLPMLASVLNEWLSYQQSLIVDSTWGLKEMLGNINLNSPVQIKKAAAAIGVQLDNTRAETLEDIARFGMGKSAELAKLLVNYRAPAQRLKMYQQSWQDKFIVDDWIHPRFWQAGTDTLRFSSSDPNIQQVPKDGRKIIGNLEGYTIVSADYSQIEVRIAAEIANDTVMRGILASDDIHRGVAAQIFACDESEVTSAQRRNAKALTFSLLFGGGANAIYAYAKMLGSDLTIDECKQLFVRFFDKFQGLAAMRKKAFAMSENQRIVSITLPNTAKRVLLGRKLSPTVILNTTVQGSAAIGMKNAIIEADRRRLPYLGATVHDELVAVVPNAEVAEYSKELEEAMIVGMEQTMPGMITKVEVKSGFCWQA